MNCLLVAATAAEISPFLQQLRIKNNLPEVDILITGIGLTAATYSLTRQLQIKRPGLIIQAGIGGCFNEAVQPGSVFTIRQDTIGDQGVIEQDRLKTLFDLQLLPENQFPYSKGWLVNKTALLKKIKLKKVKAITTNEITTSAQKIKYYKATFGPVIESMEGAALHYVCLMEKIPFIQLRSVSNYIGERNKQNWKIKNAIANLNYELTRLLEII